MAHARAYIQGANSRNSTITMSMNLEFAAYLSTYLEDMKASTQSKTVRKAFGYVGKKLVAEGKKNLQERQHTHNKTPGHTPLIETFQSKVVGGKRLKTADMKVYAGFNQHGHHAIWADRGYFRKEDGGGLRWQHTSKARYVEGHGHSGHAVRGNYFWTDVRESSQRIAVPLILRGIEKATGEVVDTFVDKQGNKLRFDGRWYKRSDFYIEKELL